MPVDLVGLAERRDDPPRERGRIVAACDRGLHHDELVTAVTRDGVLAAISIQDQGGLIDLNTASPALLVALVAGVNDGDGSVAGAIEDYKDSDKQPIVFEEVLCRLFF